MVQKIESQTFVKSKKLILKFLEKKYFATTEELIEFVSNEAEECRDKVPQALLSLVRDKKITKDLSKAKKAFVWSLDMKKKDIH